MNDLVDSEKKSWATAVRTTLRHTIDTIEPPDVLVLVLVALLVGVGTGFGTVVFVRLLEQIRLLAGRTQEGVGDTAGLLLAMGVAGLVVGYMVSRWAPEAKGHGVPEVMEAVALRGGRIRARVAAVKVLASAITIGTGGSAGREGPIVQTGAALGSTIGQLLHFSGARVRTLVACGAAAGIAATFNAPIAGVIFALEVILGSFTARYFGTVVISAVAAAITAQALLGEKQAFAVPAYPFQPAETPVYILLGILAALVAVLFIRTLYFVEGIFDEWQLFPALKTAVGMLLTAGVALLLPGGGNVLGPGLNFIGEAIAQDFSMALWLMVVLLFAKLAATCFTLGSGNSGGVFAPSLFMGAVLGGIVGSIGHALWPEVVVNPGAYAIVGMAAVFSGAARAPITAVLIVFEMSGDYKLILPLMLSTVIATFLAEHLFAESIYTYKLRLRGITLQRGRDMDLMQSLRVGEAMTKNPRLVHMNMRVTQLELVLQQTHSHSFPVVDDASKLVGMVSISDYERALEAGDVAALQVSDIATMGNLLLAYEDEPLSDAVQRLALRGVNKMPVVTHQQPDRVVGVIRREDIVKAYNLALARRSRRQLYEGVENLEHAEDLEFVELIIEADGMAANHTLAAVAHHLPTECVLVSVQREHQLIIPHGDTLFQPGDVVNCFVRRRDKAQLRACLVGEAPKVLADEGGGK